MHKLIEIAVENSWLQYCDLHCANQTLLLGRNRSIEFYAVASEFALDD
jgi:hypothetical protein